MKAPEILSRRVWEITPEALKALGVRAVLLDVDNTLQTHHEGRVHPDAARWIDAMRQEFSLCIVSNSKDFRVAPFAAAVSLPFVSLAAKPLPFGLRRAAAELGVGKEECILIGDQIYTDLLAARWAGVKMALLEPILPERGWSFRLRRRLERGKRARWSAGKEQK